MGGPKSLNPADIAVGGTIQCLEAASLGMPFEVWKTHMARNRDQGAVEAFRNVYKRNGLGSFWQGTSAKMVESFSKGAVLLFSKESIITASTSAGINPVMAGVLGGAGGGICQVTVMGPCTFLVTAKVTSTGNKSIMKIAAETFAAKGLSGFYAGGTAIAFRQATNWASRQGFTDAVRVQMKKVRYPGQENAKLSVGEEALSGMMGGAMACWNHPFEVARVEAQATAAAGGKSVGMLTTLSTVVKTQGPKALFAGLTPRVCLGIWQTLFMVTGARMVKEKLGY